MARSKATAAMPGRSAGLLMHITSLPGPYGCGDMGPEARKFADTLKRTKQTFWQLLPLTPVEKGTGYSPYSSVSAFAGNTLLISPDDLASQGLIDASDLRKIRTASTNNADFDAASRISATVMAKAYERFEGNASPKLRRAFNNFCEAERDWLDDFALYQSLKNHFAQPWYEWPDEFKSRDPRSLRSFSKKAHAEIEKVKFEQFIFLDQWNRLKAYCNAIGIRMLGDLPFYVSYDSADVWANREIFSVDKAGKMQFVAGVPPDYFNENGQLWGMPVFRWDMLKKQDYRWWIGRIRKNIQLFDVLRLDHFRAFAAFWSVPSSEGTARKGKWVKAPGDDLFDAFNRTLGTLPFIAEDLGDIDNAVHELRQKYMMPGMKVLQFAFGGDFPFSDYLPHQFTEDFVVYTGTHDNNTTRGWYAQDAGATEKANIERYFGSRVNTGRIHTLLVRLALFSVAKYAIIPVQDLLGLNGKARMNAPATVENNWRWRLERGAISADAEAWLRDLTMVTARERK